MFYGITIYTTMTWHKNKTDNSVRINLLWLHDTNTCFDHRESSSGGVEIKNYSHLTGVWPRIVRWKSTDISREILPQFLRPKTRRALIAVSCWILAWLTLRAWRWRRYDLPKRRSNLVGLHDVMPQKTELLIAFLRETHIEPDRSGMKYFA
jgi:hypothetical protein